MIIDFQALVITEVQKVALAYSDQEWSSHSDLKDQFQVISLGWIRTIEVLIYSHWVDSKFPTKEQDFYSYKDH